MPFSDSMFLFEVRLEELKSCIDAKRFRIRSQFGDVFTLHLKDPNEVLPVGPWRGTKKRAIKGKEAKVTVPSVNNALISSKINALALQMEKCPMYLCMWGKGNPFSLGSTHIPWSPHYIDYLESLKRKENPEPVTVKGTYGIYNEYNSKKMATVVLSVKLTRMATEVQPKEPPKPTKLTPSYLAYNEDPETNVSRFGNVPDCEEIGVVKTTYTGGKRPTKSPQTRKKDKMVKYEKKGNRNVIDIIDNMENKEIEIIDRSENKEGIEITNGSEYKKGELTEHNVVNYHEDKLSTIMKLIEINQPKNEILNEVDTTCESNQESQFDYSNYKMEEIVDQIDKEQKKYKSGIANLIRSNTEIDIKPNTFIKSKSCSTVEIKEHLDILDYIFAEHNGPFGNQVYCVGYCAVENDNTPSKTPTVESSPTKSVQPSPMSSKVSIKKIESKTCPLEDSERHGTGKFSFKICNDECERKAEIHKCFENVCSIDLPEEAAHAIALRKCTKLVTCEHKRDDAPPPPEEDKVLIQLKNFKQKCCEIQKVEELAGNMNMQMKMDDPCYCSCDCKFSMVRRTTYCAICGGYEIPGEPTATPPQTFPCPIFHKLGKKDKKSEKKKKKFDRESLESDKVENKNKRKRDDRFKFNYGYKGIPPQIGHSQCAMHCTGTMGAVPKRMGWLWTAGNIPGMKFRPCWKPGAINKYVWRLLRAARYPDELIAKKRRQSKPKRPLKRPLLVVEKKDGEYTVTMETMKVFNKPRLPNTYPYEDKPLVTFKIGRTDEENAMRARIKTRAKRNLEVEQRQFIQSTFQNICKDICYKTYQQALGILPGDEDPPCPCLPALPGSDRVDLERTCSCSDQSKSSDATATDDDDWLVEFTPPVALFNPAYTGKKIIKSDRETQYTYLDFQVKLLDRFGSQVPRFFIGPDGKQECSDLGGFWGPNKTWLEINYDGYIAPDGRWAPNSFIGPNGEHVDAEDGKFQTVNGKWLIVGIDGHVENGKWCFYSRPRPMPEKMKKMQAKQQAKQSKKGSGDKKHAQVVGIPKVAQPSEATWSCFGDADPKVLGKMGIHGHGHDRQLLLSTLQQIMKDDHNIVFPETPPIPTVKRRKRIGKNNDDIYDSRKYFAERMICRHPPPSDKGIQAVDERGRKTYFRLTDPRNRRPRDRMLALQEKGISLSSFHVPCLSSFIDSEVARRQNLEHILAHNARIIKKDTAN